MPFDFGLLDGKLLIELDGRQHFQQIAKWDAPEITQAKDIEKISKAIETGYSIIHIYQDEVWKDSYDWKTILKSNIELLIKEAKPQVLFISKDDVYKNHVEKLNGDIVYRKIQIEV